MGQDKGALIFKDEPLILTVLKNINNSVDEVLLILRDENQLEAYKNIINDHSSFKFDLKYYLDEMKSQGPLHGIFVGLSNISNEYGLILPCDSPYVSKSFIDNIFHKIEISNDKYEAFVPQRKNGTLEPLHSIYKGSTKEIVKKRILSGKRDIKSFIHSINTLFIDSDTLDSSGMSFKNLNRPEDIR